MYRESSIIVLDRFFESSLTAIAEVESTESAYSVMKLHGCQHVIWTDINMLLTGGNLVASSSKMSLIGADPTP